MNSVHLTLNWRRTVREFPFNSSPSKTFWDELKGDQPIIVLHFSVHSPWTSFSYMKSMNNDRLRSMIIAEAMNIDRYDHWSYWFMHECAVHAMKGYWSCMKTVDHSYEQALIMHDNVHIHVIMNIIMTPTLSSVLRPNNKRITNSLIFSTAKVSHQIHPRSANTDCSTEKSMECNVRQP